MARKGFTLIELLVVVAIIAILAAMVTPVIVQTKDVARMRQCAENLRQLGTAIARYMDDYNGYGMPPPPLGTPESRPFYENPWVLYFQPLCPNYLPLQVKGNLVKPIANPPEDYPNVYWMDSKHPPKWVTVCPGDTDRGPELQNKPSWYRWGCSYLYPGPSAYMRTTVKDKQTEQIWRQGLYPVQPTIWKNPRRDILLCDYWYDFHCGETAERNEHTELSLTPPNNILVKTVNVLFLDGHLNRVTPRQRDMYTKYTRFDDNPFYNR